MGRKDAAREIAVAAGVPVVPRTVTDARAIAELPIPVLVKAAAGGGGKGMRIVRSAGGVRRRGRRRRSARRRRAFGDDTMLVEKYVEHGRHIEVQVHRRHPRHRAAPLRAGLLDPAPAPEGAGGGAGADDHRRRSASWSRRRRSRWRSTSATSTPGTVEFLLDADTGEAYFLEMNTRLQVEHPVTELVTGLDLVELQLRVAAGEPLPVAQDDVTVTGHAIEARVYAEDSFGGFLPQAGRASIVRWPSAACASTTRWSRGQVVSTAYDPMLGKVIAHGPDRESARRALVAGARRHRDPRAHHQRRLPAGARGQRRVPRRHHRHRVARPCRRARRPTDDRPRILAAWT